MSALPADLSINCRWMLPMTERDALLEAHSLIVRDGRIVDILPSPEAAARYACVDLIERPTHVLLPGLVGARTDALLDAAPTAATLAALLRGGVTCLASVSSNPAGAARLAAERGMRIVLGLAISAAARRPPAEQVTEALRLRDEFKTHPLVSTAFAPDVASDLDEAVFERIATLADELDSPLLVSLHASAEEIGACLTAHRMRPIDRLHQLGLLTPALNAAHMVHVTPSDLELALRSGISVTLTPSTDLERDSGTAPVAKYMAHQMRLALGGLYRAPDAEWDPWFDIRLLDLLPPAVHGHDGVALWDCLAAATIGGAAALGLDHEIGSLQIGKWADACCVDLGRAARAPRAPVSSVVRSGGRERISDVWVAGRPLMREGLFMRSARS